MSQFVTISPTHVSGKKEYAWKQFLEKGYIAIGWMDVDLTGKSIEEVKSIIRKEEYSNENAAIDAFTKFLTLRVGDYVAVNNANHGLFGIGVVDSGYQYMQHYHDSGTQEESYSNIIRVKWIHKGYVKRKDILESDETGWQPYGTMGKLYSEVPLYIRRLLGEKPALTVPSAMFEIPEFLKPIVRAIESLRSDSSHQERAHESLVEDFLVALDYNKHTDIKFRQGRIDLSIWEKDTPLMVIEVKREWDLNLYKSSDAIKQAYAYALDIGCRLVVVTNGDDYLLFDRIKGLSINTNVVGQFRISALTEDDLAIIERLRPSYLRNPNVPEILRFIAESFSKNTSEK
jgi:hypothetical protein